MAPEQGSEQAVRNQAAANAPGRGMAVALWVLQAVLALFLAFASALPKLIAHPSATETFDRIGYGDWFMYLIGVLELAGAIGLLVPLLSGIAATALSGLMVGAFVYQVTVFEGEFWFTPVILLVLFALIAWGRRDRTARLLTLLAGRT
ncbi:putative membrane protein YphA (DoxX/SURF4 family) [Lipingzhangella halophila]|uniref:Putative membrane protein YphA (DoxX/SURF4 family) n=1 Tax=Lipingzhangella halophila TaxID=1783352 RepID=A0A7W7RE15_9ACTN|nr:DoxX family protein [Lipingzhangella halophila]MBB4929933.1 putative membrane protein YphA (DoxX/SURF4 family) [Lipingzhangella halophila]